MLETDWIFHQVSLRLSFFGFGLLLFLGLGHIFPYRRDRSGYWRQIHNLSLTGLSAILMRVLLPWTLAELAAGWSVGVFSVLNVPFIFNMILSIFLLDLLIYGQHILFHKVPWLWRLHRVHHTDPEFDSTTALRFHPVEIFLSILLKGLAVVIFGIHPLAILLFEVMLNFSAMFNHANFSLPKWLETPLVKVFVTPDMHRVHHSPLASETDSNYGFCLSIWDQAFGTFCHHSERDLRHDEIGLEGFRAQKDQRLDRLLIQPWLGNHQV